MTMHERRPLFVLTCLVWLPGAGLAQENELVNELRRLEDALSVALVERDVEALSRLWHDDLVFIARNGQQSSKGQRLAGLRAAGPARPGETNTNDEIAVRIIGDTAVVTVVSTWTIPSDGAMSVGRYRALHVWTRQLQHWQLLAAQVASLAE